MRGNNYGRQLALLIQLPPKSLAMKEDPMSPGFNHTQTGHGSLKEIYLKTEQKRSFGISKPDNHQSLES